MRKRIIFIFILLCVLSLNFVLPDKSLALVGDYTGVTLDISGSGNDNPIAVTSYNGFFWVTDASNDSLYKYNSDGTYTGVVFDLSGSGLVSPEGITTYNDFFWIVDAFSPEVYKFNPDGTYTGVSFDTAGSGNAQPQGITAYNNFFWIVDTSDDEVYKYNSDGTYTGVSFDTAGSGNGQPTGLVFAENFFWIGDNADDEVYKYNPDGTYTGVSFDTAASGNDNFYGITYVDDFFWTVDNTDKLLYKYEGRDTVSPTVDSLTPADDAVDVDVLTNQLTLTFDETVVVGSGYVTIYNASDDSIFETLDVTDLDQVEADGVDVYLYLSLPLVGDTEYYVKVDATAFDDTSGNSFAGIANETTWNFTTYDDVSPVASFSPEDNDTGVSIDTDLVFHFNENVNIDDGELIVYKTADDTEVETVDLTSEQVSGDGTDTITVHLLNRLDKSTSYYVFVGDSFYDGNDNYYSGIADATTWNFETERPSSSGSRSKINKVTVPQTPVVLPPNSSVTPTMPTTPNQPDKFIFTKSLWTQIIDPDVKELQKYLNTHGYPVALSGAGSLGNETEKFGNLTRNTLIKFQIANHITPAVGFFGPITRGVVNSGL